MSTPSGAGLQTDGTHGSVLEASAVWWETDRGPTAESGDADLHHSYHPHENEACQLPYGPASRASASARGPLHHTPGAATRTPGTAR